MILLGSTHESTHESTHDWIMNLADGNIKNIYSDLCATNKFLAKILAHSLRLRRVCKYHVRNISQHT